MNTYFNAMIDSLNKKIEVLEEIHKMDEEQLALTTIDPFPYEEFDKNVDEKSLLIYKLNKLDEGFELVYNKIKEEMQNNKAAYASEIKTMQELIKKVTDLSVQIQAEEARNKSAMEAAFRNERKRIKGNRSGVKAVKSYTQTMRAGATLKSGWEERK